MRQNARTGDRVPQPAWILGLAGLIPFGLGTALVWAGKAGLAVWPSQTGALAALAAYGAVILSFMGGCRWGFAALEPRPDWGRLGLSVLPALVGWAALLAGGRLSLGLLAAGFVALLAADLALTRAGGAPAWWPRLRWPLTLGAVASLSLAAVA